LLTQGKDDNEAGRKKDKPETANLSAREYNYRNTARDMFERCSIFRSTRIIDHYTISTLRWQF